MIEIISTKKILPSRKTNLKLLPGLRYDWSYSPVAHHQLHVLYGGVGVDVLEVRHLVLLGPGLAVETPPAQLPVDEAEAVHVSSLPAVEYVLIDALVQQLGGHVALGAHLVVEGDVHLPVLP